MIGLVDGLGFFADALILVGVWMVGDRRIAGWYIGLAGVVLSLWYAAIINSYPIVFIEIVFIGIYVRNIFLWRKKPTSGSS
ncbi:hypothetical protein IX51_01185 [uncultured archaeon]|nr:hypothetical protein IX51_01185 [uncultured archaeon]